MQKHIFSVIYGIEMTELVSGPFSSADKDDLQIYESVKDWWTNENKGLNAEAVRQKSLDMVKTFKTVKKVIWECSRKYTDDGNKEIPKRN